MKHSLYFSGYSDDVVLAGSTSRDWDEHYATFFLLSNGMVIKADHGDDGWKIEPTEMPADGVTIIEAVDQDYSGKDHDDSRLPEWLRKKAYGYAPVCIIESEEPLEIVAESRKPFPDTLPEFIRAARLHKAVRKAANWSDDDMPPVSAFVDALKALKF